MLGDLLRRRRIDDAELRAHDDIRDRGIAQGVAEAEGGQALAGDDILDLEGGAVSVQIVDGGVDGGVVLEENQGDVVGGGEGHIDARCGWDEVGIDFPIERGVDRCLAVLGGNYDERVIVDVLGLESCDDFAEGGIDKVDGLEERRGKVKSAVLVPAGLLGNRNGLEVPAK